MSSQKTFRGYKPREWQRYVHNGIAKNGFRSGHIHIVKAKRQIGKSMIIENELLRFAINYKHTVNICLSLTLSSCRKIYRDLITAIQDSGIISRKNDSLLEIELYNGSQIIFKSAQQKETLRGYTVSGILCIDEAAYIPDDVFNIVMPYVDVNNAPVLMVSTPRLKEGTFWNYYSLGLINKGSSVTTYDLCQFDTSEFLSDEKLELYRKSMPRNQFITEYLGEFIDEGGNVFETSDLNWISGQANGWMPQKGTYGDLYIGIDWANGGNGDDTVITGFDESGTQIFLRYFGSKKPLEQIDTITHLLQDILDTSKIRKVTCESNSIGAVYIDMLKSKNPNVNILEFTTTNSSKREIIEGFAAGISNGTVKLMREQKQVREIAAYSMEITKNGSITYNAPYGMNDDICIADAIAFHSISSNKGTYNISFSKDKEWN